jgi:hypothetical protein
MSPPQPGRRVVSVAVILALSVACATRRVSLPTGPGAPFPEFAAAYADAVSECRKVTSLKATLGLSGHAGSTKLRGHIDAGFAAPASIRLEGFPPLSFSGRPIFTLVARGEAATLVLPRDRRVLRGAPPSAIVEALSGVPLSPADLRAVVSGCGFGDGDPSAGRSYGNGLAAVDAGTATIVLRQVDGHWRIVAATRQTLQMEYADLQSGRPATIRLRSGTTSDVTLKLSDVELNPLLEPAVFEVVVPGDAAPITLEELRRAGPLGTAARSSQLAARGPRIRDTDQGLGIRD